MLGLGAKNKPGKWYTNWRDHRASTIVDQRWDKKKKAWVPQRNHGTKINPEKMDYPLTELQESCNVYEPIEAYEEDWDHNEKTGQGTPIPGTRRRSDLPPLYIQWKDDWKRRLNAKKTAHG
tara:strand:+ start:1291 stop:1653 length:363 start_codon:yes stop_codon:yes gene_type:complete